MAYENYEKYMLERSVQHNHSADAADKTYFRFGDRRQPHKNIILKENLINFDSLKRQRPRKYV